LSRAGLAADGRKIVLERVVARSEGESIVEDGTGEISVYDLQSPSAPVQVNHPELGGPQSGRVCISPDAALMIYAAAGRAHIVDLRAQVPAVPVASMFQADRWTQCVFAGQ
jgi:hypothetical protein